MVEPLGVVGATGGRDQSWVWYVARTCQHWVSPSAARSWPGLATILCIGWVPFEPDGVRGCLWSLVHSALTQWAVFLNPQFQLPAAEQGMGCGGERMVVGLGPGP